VGQTSTFGSRPPPFRRARSRTRTRPTRNRPACLVPAPATCRQWFLGSVPAGSAPPGSSRPSMRLAEPIPARLRRSEVQNLHAAVRASRRKRGVNCRFPNEASVRNFSATVHPRTVSSAFQTTPSRLGRSSRSAGRARPSVRIPRACIRFLLESRRTSAPSRNDRGLPAKTDPLESRDNAPGVGIVRRSWLSKLVLGAPGGPDSPCAPPRIWTAERSSLGWGGSILQSTPGSFLGRVEVARRPGRRRTPPMLTLRVLPPPIGQAHLRPRLAFRGNARSHGDFRLCYLPEAAHRLRPVAGFRVS
jgi:hypothetical protein